MCASVSWHSLICFPTKYVCRHIINCYGNSLWKKSPPAYWITYKKGRADLANLNRGYVDSGASWLQAELTPDHFSIQQFSINWHNTTHKNTVQDCFYTGPFSINWHNTTHENTAFAQNKTAPKVAACVTFPAGSLFFGGRGQNCKLKRNLKSNSNNWNLVDRRDFFLFVTKSMSVFLKKSINIVTT